jgi:hypothetical protein
MRLPELQRAFAARMLTGDDAIMPLIQDSRLERRDVLMGVYEHAYGSRLAEVLEGDYEKLHAALGADAFLQMAAGYLTAHPSRHPNARYFGAGLPAFLAETAPWSERPWLSELTALEWAMGEVFLAEDAPHLAMEAMAAVHPNDWPMLAFSLAADIRRITTQHGGPEAWLALNDDTDPAPAAAEADKDPQAWLIWRDDFQANFRAMDAAEAWALNEADGGATFAELCEGLMEWVPAEEAAGQAAGYLRGWIEAGVLAGYEIREA